MVPAQDIFYYGPFSVSNRSKNNGKAEPSKGSQRVSDRSSPSPYPVLIRLPHFRSVSRKTLLQLAAPAAGGKITLGEGKGDGGGPR
jgi:hypothetical protein